MRRFPGQAIAAVAILLGLGLFDLGPSARAGFMSVAAEPTAVGENKRLDIDQPSRPDAPPAPPANPGDALPASPPGGGASSGSGGSTTAPSYAELPTRTDLTPPPLVTFLLALQGVFLPDPVASAIFHPPRAS